MAFPREWDGKQWQAYTLKLVQLRHGAHSVQIVPDKVRGDAGIEFFTMDGCVYQSYAPEEAFDTAKAASAMKAKGNRDLGKLQKNKAVVAASCKVCSSNVGYYFARFLTTKRWWPVSERRGSR